MSSLVLLYGVVGVFVCVKLSLAITEYCDLILVDYKVC